MVFHMKHLSIHVEVETELIQKFQEVQLELKNLNHDFQVLANIAGLVSTLNNTYTVTAIKLMCPHNFDITQTLTSENVNNHCRVLQRKLEAGHELVRSCEPRRADIIIHSKYNMFLLAALPFIEQTGPT